MPIRITGKSQKLKGRYASAVLCRTHRNRMTYGLEVLLKRLFERFRYGQCDHIDALIAQRFALFYGSHATNRAFGCLVVMHAARLFGKALADVFGA